MTVDAKDIIRCEWCGERVDYISYHDNEWGLPVQDDVRLFEKICLEGFQSGLSWITILRKREGFRGAFHDFDIDKVASMTEADVERLTQDAGIVRHPGKIRSVINNAGRALELQREFGSLAAYFWNFEPCPEDRPGRVTPQWLRENPVSPQSSAMSADLKRRGWSFIGPVTIYAFMQAMGLVNDHVEGCFFRERAKKARGRFIRPLPHFQTNRQLPQPPFFSGR